MLVQKTYTTHEPVMIDEVMNFLNLKPGDRVVDMTLGLGGHSSEILKRIGPKGFLYAFEKDEENLNVAKDKLLKVGRNFEIFHESFVSLKNRLRGKGLESVQAIFFDLGLSSPHVDDPERGFSFLRDGPLDMRFDKREGLTAANLLNTLPEQELSRIFWEYGEEPMSRKLAAAVVFDRKKMPFEGTQQFADFVERVLGKEKGGKHRATKAFQALRIAVNEELDALELALTQAIESLAPQGRVVVLSYHSLEDRIVKSTFKSLATDLRDPTDIFGGRVLRPKILSLLSKKPIKASDNEVAKNKRARSALLRAAEKL